LALADTLADGMLSLAPSLNAAVALLKYAYSVTVPMRIGSVQDVVMLTGAFPFATPFRTRAKFTNPGAAITVMELLREALRLTFAIFDFNWAWAARGSIGTATNNVRAIPTYPPNFCFPPHTLPREINMPPPKRPASSDCGNWPFYIPTGLLVCEASRGRWLFEQPAVPTPKLLNK
jgi:hypothetical protein